MNLTMSCLERALLHGIIADERSNANSGMLPIFCRISVHVNTNH